MYIIMCKNDKMILEDQIREEYADFSLSEIFEEIDRLNREEESDENTIRYAVLDEMKNDKSLNEDMYLD